MCHHYESRDLEALRERLEETAADADPDPERPETATMDREPDDEGRLPPIQPSD